VSDPNLAELEEVFCAVVKNGGTVQEAIATVLRANTKEMAKAYETPEERILRATCQHYGIKVADLLHPCREERFTRRRYAAMFAMHLAGIRPSDGARAIGHLDHSMFYYAIEKAGRRPDIKADGEKIHSMAFALGAERRAA